MAVCRVVLVAAMVPVLPSIVHIPAVWRDHFCEGLESAVSLQCSTGYFCTREAEDMHEPKCAAHVENH